MIQSGHAASGQSTAMGDFDSESPCCAWPLVRPDNEVAARYPDVQWCPDCWTPWDNRTGRIARKGCAACAASLALLDPDLCDHCQDHGIIIYKGRPYAPVD